MAASKNGGAVATPGPQAGGPAPASHPTEAGRLAEADRLAQLRALVVLDSPPEPVFDNIARLASEVCGAPIALLSLIDAERQWFKANVGLAGVNETPRDVAFCAHAIGQDNLFEVPDATLDERFATNPLVTGAPDIRFYAGAPLVLPGGARVGTLCVIDRQARQLDDRQARMLKSLAAIASQTLVMRRDLITRSLAVRSEFEQALADSEARHRAIVEDQAELVSLARPSGELVYVNPAYARHFGQAPAQMVGCNLFDYVEPGDRDGVRARVAGVLQTGQSTFSENRMVAADGSERWVAWTNRAQHDARGQVLLHSVGRDVTEHKRMDQALRASQALLQRTGRVAGVGGWELELASGVLTWSDETRRIHEAGTDFVPTLDGALAFYPPQARTAVESAVRGAMDSGTPWDMELPFVTARGRSIWVRTQGEVELEDGAPARLIGAFQDITARKLLEQQLADSARFVRQITDSLPVRIAYLDTEGRYRFVNLAHAVHLGLEREQILGRTRSELTGGRSDAVVEPRLKAVLAGRAQRFEYEEEVDGQRHQIESQLIPDLSDTGEVRGFYSTGIDITERTATERALRELTAIEIEARRQLERQAATLRSVTEAIPAIVAVVGSDGRYRFVNSGFERWFGVSRDDVVGRTLVDVLGQPDYERTRPWAERVLKGETVKFERDYPGRGGKRHLAVTYVPLWLETGGVDGFVGVAQDITPHRQEEERLLQLTLQDPLTGLLNRAGFEDYLERRLKEGSGPGLALLCIDLDRFKPVNDRHGHPVGDQVLQLFAQRLRALVRPTDGVARLGGDEFAIVLPGMREGINARAVADKVIRAAHSPFELGALRVEIGASVGVAYGADPGIGWRDLVVRADAMLYKAKESGRGRQAGTSRL